MRKMREANFSLLVLLYSIVVILWGAWVRISGSGAGCGENWPLCHNEFIPMEHSLPTWIEFSHRLSSGFYGLLVLSLVVITFRHFPKGHWARKGAVATALFTITEALLGAKLVLSGLVAENSSVARAYTMMLHMANSMLLTGSVALVYDWARLGKPTWKRWPAASYRMAGVIFPLLILMIAVTGSIAALSGTLFPSQSLLEGLLKDLSRDSHFLLRLRIWHPVLATIFGATIFFVFYNFWLSEVRPQIRSIVGATLIILAIAIIFGYATLFSLSPLWMKLTHLALAHAVWIFIILTFSRLFVGDGKSPSV